MSEQLSASQFHRKGRVKTSDGSKYLQRLCKHFSHRVSADWDENRGKVTFAEGTCSLQADASGLQMTCSANSQQELVEIVDTLDRHFIRFAKAEAPTLIWQ